MNWSKIRISLVALLFIAVAGFHPPACFPSDSGVEKNVVYGMVNGAALLLDVYHPATSSGLGIILIPGSGWHSYRNYGTEQLKDQMVIVPDVTQALIKNGYTVFVINHRTAPLFHFPAAIEDARRAVRFIRSNASKFKIDPEKLGGFGVSSGGHLIALLGVEDGLGNPSDIDPVEQVSSKIQCAVTIAAPYDLYKLENAGAAAMIVSFMGEQPVYVEKAFETPNYIYNLASPIMHITADDANFLLIHSTSDEMVPPSTAIKMSSGLNRTGAESALMLLDSNEHVPKFDVMECIKWFDKHLKK